MELGQQKSEVKARSVYFFALLSAMTAVAVKLADAYISRNVIKIDGADNRVVAACVFLTLGGLMGSVVFLTLAHTPFGRMLDPRFNGLCLGTRRFQWNALVGGSTGAISTGLYLLALQKGFDAATLVALGSSQLLWIMGYEYWKSKDHTPIKSVALPALLMIAGVWVGEGLSGASLEVCLLVFVASALLAGISEVHDKIATEESNATLATVWRFLYLGTFGTTLSIAYIWYLGKSPLYWGLIRTTWYLAVPPIAILMTFSFLTNGWNARAKAHLDMGASKVSLISNLRIVGVLLALCVLNLAFGLKEFGQLPTDPILLLRKVLGALIITASVIWLIRNKNQNKTA